MSTDPRWLADAIPTGQGLALDVGGGKGTLRTLVERKGWRYVNLDLNPPAGVPAVRGDVHALPFEDSVFDLVIIKDALEHFVNPWQALAEVRRVMKDGGTLVIWVPFMHPFHGDDYYRFTPLGLEKLLTGFRIVRFEAPLWVFSVIGLAVVESLKRMGLGFLQRPIKEMAWRLDRLVQPRRARPRAFAGAYLLVAIKERECS